MPRESAEPIHIASVNDDVAQSFPLHLEERLRVLLPEMYDLSGEGVRPAQMRSAALKFGPDGLVLWDEMWGSFCDLAMAGGPPHRGTLLEPDVPADSPARTAAERVAAEICRGLGLVTGLCAEPSSTAGWLHFYCTSAAMAGWLQRAIVMENVAAKATGLTLLLPAGPAFRLEREIKNVITAVAKTCHYWRDHMSEQKRDIVATLLREMEREAPLVQVSAEGDGCEAELARAMAADVFRETGLTGTPSMPRGWLGFECANIPVAVRMMRALAAQNLLARREGTSVLISSATAAPSVRERSLEAAVRAYRYAQAV